MGNRNANDDQNNNVNINGGVHEHILIENENNNNQKKLDPPSVKKIHAVRNPFSIKKNSLFSPFGKFFIEILLETKLSEGI